MSVIGYRVILVVLVGVGAVTLALTQTNQIAVPAKQSVTMVNVMGVVGGTADLPCDTSLPSPDDRVLLVLWYRDGINTPVYSFDARKHSLHDVGWTRQQQRGWSTESQPSSRTSGSSARSVISGQFSYATSLLTLMGLRTSDAGFYRCRVDFKMSPTRNARVNLTVIVPPESLVITDEMGKGIKDVAGPFDENGVLILTCEAIGGQPSSKVSWWRDNRLIDTTSESITHGRVRNTLRIPNLARSDHGVNLTCQASNNNISTPISTDLVIDMKLRPLGLKRVNGDSQGFSSDRDYDFECISWGARPPASISWWKGNTRLQSSKQSVSIDGNVTSSVLTYAPAMDDQDKILRCRVDHPLLQAREMELGWKLNIHYVPVVHLELASSERHGDIKEGDVVHLECHVRASPLISRLFWRHNGKQIQLGSMSGDIVMQNQTLIIKSVDHRWSGLFTCVASNTEGDGESNALALNVQYSPICKFSQIATHFVTRGETVQVLCEVQAFPGDLIFHWTFNGTQYLVNSISGANYVNDQLTSSLSYRPVSDQDYGTLMCWARNLVGEQSQPCVFQVVEASVPNSLTDCTATNITWESVHVACRPGYDGGVPQHFRIQVVMENSPSIVTNRSAHLPSFPIHNLEANSNYIITIWAENIKGRSDAQVIPVTTLHATGPTRMKSSDVSFNISASSASHTPMSFPWITVVSSALGVGFLVVFVLVMSTIIVRLRRHQHHDYDKHKASIPLQRHSCDSQPTHRTCIIDEDNATDEDQAQQGATLQKREYKKNPAVIRDEDGSVKQVDHVRSNSKRKSCGSSNEGLVTSHPPQPSGYVRLPLVDQYPMMAEDISTSASHSYGSGRAIQTSQHDHIPLAITKVSGEEPLHHLDSTWNRSAELIGNRPVSDAPAGSMQYVVAEPYDSTWVGTTRF